MMLQPTYRCYVKAMGSVCYDKTGITFPYKGAEYVSVEWLEKQGATNVKWEPQFGWNNQPDVLTFECDEWQELVIEDLLPLGLTVALHWEEDFE